MKTMMSSVLIQVRDEAMDRKVRIKIETLGDEQIDGRREEKLMSLNHVSNL